MFTKKVNTGFANVTVTRNGKPIDFEVKLRKDAAFWWEDMAPIHPEGCYEIIVNLLACKIGDIIRIEFDKGELQCDGGGERMDNIVGHIADYTVAMGCPATEEYEDDWDEENWPKDMYFTDRVLPYGNMGFTKYGFEFEILDDPVKYYDNNWRWNIEAIVAWEKTCKEHAWGLVSYLTS